MSELELGYTLAKLEQRLERLEHIISELLENAQKDKKETGEDEHVTRR